MQARPGDAGFHRQRQGESQEREQGAQFFRVGQVRGLQRKAFGLEIAEHGFYRPALAITRERVTRAAGTGQGQQFTGGEPRHHKPHRRGQSHIVIAEPAAALDDHSFSDSEMPRDGGNRHSGIAFAQDMLVLAQAQDEGDVPAL